MPITKDERIASMQEPTSSAGKARLGHWTNFLCHYCEIRPCAYLLLRRKDCCWRAYAQREYGNNMRGTGFEPVNH